MLETPTVGRIIHVKAVDDSTRPALVVDVTQDGEGDTTLGLNVNLPGNIEYWTIKVSAYAADLADASRGQWTWPPRA